MSNSEIRETVIKSEDQCAIRQKIINSKDEYYNLVIGDSSAHEIIIDSGGSYRWKEDPLIGHLFDKGILDLNKHRMSKNDPLLRELYRKLGYSLMGYWEIFFWDANNEDFEDWVPPSE